MIKFEYRLLKCDEFVVHVVDPDQAIGDGLATLLNTYGIDVHLYPDANTFLQSWSTAHQSRCCLLVEAELPELSGPALIQRLLDSALIDALVKLQHRA